MSRALSRCIFFFFGWAREEGRGSSDHVWTLPPQAWTHSGLALDWPLDSGGVDSLEAAGVPSFSPRLPE